MVPVRQSTDPRHSKLWADIGTFRDRLRLAANERHRGISMELIGVGLDLGIEFGSTRISVRPAVSRRHPARRRLSCLGEPAAGRRLDLRPCRCLVGLGRVLRVAGRRRPGPIRGGVAQCRRPRRQRDDAWLHRAGPGRWAAGPVPDLAQQHHRRRVRGADAAAGLRGAPPLEHRPPVPVHPRWATPRGAAGARQDPRGLRPLAADRRARRGPHRGVGHVPDRPRHPRLGLPANGRIRHPHRRARPRLDAARRPARRPPRGHPRGATHRGGALLPMRPARSSQASRCARRRAMPAPAWSPRTRSGPDPATCRPEHRCSR